MTPLHVAAEKGDRLEIVKYLISKEADINITDYNGVSETKLVVQQRVLYLFCCLNKGFISLQALKLLKDDIRSTT